MSRRTPEHYWRPDAHVLMRQLDSTREGLSAAEAAKRLREYRTEPAERASELFGEPEFVACSDRARGLSMAEARTRLAHFGLNQLAAERPVPRWRKFVAQFGDVLVVLLLIATAISFVLWLYDGMGHCRYEAMATARWCS